MLSDDENYIMRLHEAYYRPMYSQIKKIVGDDEIQQYCEILRGQSYEHHAL